MDCQFGGTLALPVDDALLVRLHGEACITCGTTTGPLVPAGHRYTRNGQGGHLGWAVVACTAHRVAPRPTPSYFDPMMEELTSSLHAALMAIGGTIEVTE